jgi:hypothetical protein
MSKEKKPVPPPPKREIPNLPPQTKGEVRGQVPKMVNPPPPPTKKTD